MKNGIYTVTSDNDLIANGLSKSAAIKLAGSSAAKYAGESVHVSYMRDTDGQIVYLNGDGNYAITGEAWSPAAAPPITMADLLSHQD